MNSLASTKCAGRLLMALAAISGIFLAVGCGSGSGFVPPNNNGFSNSDLNGTYVLAISGTDVSADPGSFFAIVGTMTADGNGNITGGTVDINDPILGGVFTGQTVSASKYSVTQDGRGTGTLVTPKGNFGLDFVLSTSSHGLITRFDSDGSGSGTLDLQGTASSLTSMAFSFAGVDAGENSLGTVGAFTLNSSGTITSGIEDFNDNGSSADLTSLPLTGSVVLTSTTSGTATLSTNFGTLGFDVWVIGQNDLKFIETDALGLVLSGDAFTQQTSFTAGQLVFTLGGFDLSQDFVAAGGFVTTDVNGNLSAGLEDYNNEGNPNTVPVFSGSCNAAAPFAQGRCQLASTGFTNGVAANLEFAAYPSSGGVLLLEDDSAGIIQGAAYAQTATAFVPPNGYALNLSGANPNGEVDDIAQFNATSAVSPAINMSGVLDENNINGEVLSDVGLSGYYTPDSPATGRGSINVPNIGTNIGTLNLEYYVVDASTVVFIDVDSEANDAPQVAVGTFELQNSSAGGAVKSRVATVHPIVHPTVRPHGALRRK